MIRKYYTILCILLLTFSGAIAQINFNSSASFKYLKGKDAAALPANWMTSDYSPAGWLNGNLPFRYGDGTGGTELGDMQNNYSTVYLRSTFTASQIQNLEDVYFSVNYDDGFIIWINGEEVFRLNAPAVPAWNSFSTALHVFGDFTTYLLPAHDILLNEGENTIAIQGFNTTLESSAFYFDLKINADIPSPQTSDSLKVVFSKPNGFYDEPFDLTMNVPDDSYNLLYTIDGSNPQNSPTRMNGGKSSTITIDPDDSNGRASTPCFIVRASLQKDGLNPSFPLTQTYIFLDRVISQSDPGGDWPSSGNVNGQVIDLEMDPRVTNDPKYSGKMKLALTDIPTISVVTDEQNLFDPGIGIYVNAQNHGENWERMCSVELINPSGTPGFDINAGLRIRGGWSRHSEFPKHAFRLFFRSEYGAPKLKFPLFENEGVDEFDKIDLRCEQNYAWSKGDNVRRNTAVREVFSRDTQRDMGQPYTRSRYYHLYLNGMYWGLYQTQERAEARFASSYFGGSTDDYDVVKVNTDGYSVEATDGNIDSWQKLYNMTKTGFSTNAAYFALEGKDASGNPQKGGEILIDIDNLIDYVQLIFYTGNFDAPTSSFGNNQGPNNFYAIDKRDDRSTGFIFFAHDAEHSMMIGAEPYGGPGIGINENRVTIPNMSVSDITKFHPQWLHYKLSSNKEYRQRFADRVYKNFYNNGVFTPTSAHDRFQKRAAEITNAIIGESARWGDFTTGSNPPMTFDDWDKEIKDIYARFIPVRTNIVLTQLKTAGLYFLFDPPVFTKDNIKLTEEDYTVSGNYQLTVSGTTGQIYYTTDGTDPRLIGDLTNPTAKLISTDSKIDLQGTAIVKARVKSGDRWSALAEVKFIDPLQDYSKLKVTELHYHPKDSLVDTLIVSGKSFEFVELKNTGDKTINLSGLNFTSSIDYQFPGNEVLPPHQFYVIASKPKWFWERHFMVPNGNFGKNLSNSGEQVTLSDSIGNPVIDFLYSGLNPWAPEPDGQGPSLSAALKLPTGNPADFNYWMASSVYDGTPFADDPGIIDSLDDFNLSENSVIIYPNPTSGLIHLKVKEAKSEIRVDICSLSGSMIYQSKMGENKDIDFRSLNIYPGIYLVNVKCNENVSVHKVIYQP